MSGNTSSEEHAVFRYHFLLGADWKACCARLGCNRGQFLHAVYRVQHKLGRAFRTLQPHALFPLSDYFQGTVPGARAIGSLRPQALTA
jgi:hypothetical protein